MSGYNKYKIKWTKDACYEEAKKYKSRSEFERNAVGAYDKSREMGWIDDYTWFEVLYRGKYTYEEVKEIAERCETLAEFTKNHVGAYEAALNNDWLKDFTHLKRKNSYTVDSIKEMCKNFSSSSEFIKYNQSAYNAFLRFYKRGEIADNDIPWKSHNRKSWDYESCYTEAKKYDSSWHFKLGSESAYNRARKEGWLKEYIWFRNPRKIYDYNICKELAEQFESRMEFLEACSGAYSASVKNGWIKDFVFSKDKQKWDLNEVIELCKLYKTKKALYENDIHAYYAYVRFRKKGVITDDMIQWEIPLKGKGDPEAKIHYVYCYDFGNKAVYVGRTNNPEKRDRRHRIPHHSHHKTTEQTVLKYSKENGIPIPDMTILESQLNIQESRRQEAYWVNYYKELGYKILNVGVVGEYSGSVGSYIYRWTEDAVREFAKGFKNITQMSDANQQAARMVREYGLMDELFPDHRKINLISYEEAKEKAADCSTAYQFNKKYSKYYNTSRTHGWLKDFFPKTNEAVE